MPSLLALAAATLVSEDLACIAAGLMIQQRRLDALAGVAACAVGIFVGDVGLYVAGRIVGAPTFQWPIVRRYVTEHRHEQVRAWIDAHLAAAIAGSRFVPGTRLPLYLVCGATRVSLARFALWCAVWVAIWTPALVMATSKSSAIIPSPLLAALLPLVLYRLTVSLHTRRGRQRAIAFVSRIWRWEFWPMWLFYAPVALWILWLAVRHRGIGALAAANPGMPDGGIVGESKHGILSRLPEECTIPSVLIPAGPHEQRLRQVLTRLTRHDWSFPLVFKPDVGQRGSGVKLVRSLEEASAYLAREQGAVVVQPYHPGPFEAGVFYYRFPGEARGRILSITDKHFPVVIGDGHSTLADLIWAHPRLRMQAATFLARHADRCLHVLGAGERFALAMAGNHAQGTLFKDGRHLITAALEDRIDAIAWSYGGFYVGRFDIRYTDVERFKAGEDLAIVELNGATAESTNIYDPDGSLVGAYRQLFRQWAIVFAIGAINREHGASAASLHRLVELVRAHLASKPAFQTSD